MNALIGKPCRTRQKSHKFHNLILTEGNAMRYLSRCKVLSVKDNVIEIEGIDAFADTPVLDLKN